MAEFLIYNKDHWMDVLTEKQLAGYVAKYPDFLDRRKLVAKKGDIIEVKEDGHWTGKGRGYDKEHFAVVILKDVPLKDVVHLRKGLYKDNFVLHFDEATMTHKALNETILVRKNGHYLGTFKDKQEVSMADITTKVVE